MFWCKDVLGKDVLKRPDLFISGNAHKNCRKGLMYASFRNCRAYVTRRFFFEQ